MIRTAFGLAVLVVVMFAASSGPASVSAGGGCHHAGPLTDESSVAVDMAGNCFDPMVIRISEGDTVTWTNRDAEVHTVTGAAQSFGDFDEIAAGESVSYTFADTGVFPYYCVFHPSMVGAVVVGNGVPAGEDAAASITQPSDGGDGGGASVATIAAIAAAVALGGAAVGLVGTRVLSSRRSRTPETL